MCASPLRLLRAGPPPPRVALLPDAMFFTRVVPVSPGATPAEAATQIELAIEAFSPFPLTQLYYGWYRPPGAEHALVFAAYRRRFTTEQAAEWSRAELVLPAFGSVLGAEVDPGTTVVLNTPEALTAVHWDAARVPAKIVVRPVSAELAEEGRAKERDALLRDIGGSKKVMELESPLAPESALSDREIAFRDGDFVARVPAAIAATLDVRDKAELAALRSARRRDILLWRVTLGAAAALLLLGLGELALMGGRAWQQVRERQYLAQKPRVDKIESTHELTRLIEDLKTKRLLPLEMVTQIVGEDVDRIPADILFTRMQADKAAGLYTLVVEGTTNNSAQVNAYETTVRNLPSVQSANAQFQQASGARATFVMRVVFKPETLKPVGEAVASSK